MDCTRGKLTAAAVDAGDGKPGHGGLGGMKAAMTGAGVGRGLTDAIKGLLLCPPIMRVASRCCKNENGDKRGGELDTNWVALERDHHL